MRIAFVVSYYRPHTGGLEILTEQLALDLRERGHDVWVLTSIGPNERTGHERVGGIDVWRNDVQDAVVRRDHAEILRGLRDSMQVIRELDPDVVHAHDALPWTWLYLRVVRLPRPPIVETLHTVMSEQIRRTGAELPGLQTILREVDWVTGVSREVVDDARRLEPSMADRISAVVNGIPPSAAAFEPVGDGRPRLVCVGRLSEEKGFDRAVRATATLVAHGHDVQLDLVGEGPARAQLVALARELGISGRVRLLGEVPHDRVADHLRDATVVLMPSLVEGFPLVALEAAQAGRPVVGAAVPGIAEAVVDGRTGVLVHHDDDLPAAIEGLLVDRGRARALGAAARARVEREFSLAGCADAYLDIYRRVG